MKRLTNTHHDLACELDLTLARELDLTHRLRRLTCPHLALWLLLVLFSMIYVQGEALACQSEIGSSFPDKGQACALEGTAADDPNLLALPGTLTRSGNPVDFVSGRKSLRRLQLQFYPQTVDVFGQGLPLTWSLFYDSGPTLLGNKSESGLAGKRPLGGFGLMWRHGYELSLSSAQLAGKSASGMEALVVRIHQADGLVHRFVYRPERGVFAAEQAELGEIQTFDAGPSRRWVWRQAGGRQATFDATGRLKGWRSPLGQRLDLDYSATGRLIEITHSKQNQTGSLQKLASIHLQWDAQQRLISAVELKEERENAKPLLMARCQYRYAGEALDAPLLIAASCTRTGQADRNWSEQYFYEDQRFGEALTRVRQQGPHQAPLEASYVYDESKRVIKSQGFGEAAHEALTITYSTPTANEAPWRRLQRQGQSVEYRLEASAGRGGFASMKQSLGHWRRQDDGPCAWCPDLASKHEMLRDRVGRVVELRDAKSKQWLERRRYETEDATELPVEIQRPSVRDGAFASSRFERNPQGLVLAIEHQGFSPKGSPTAFEAIQRRIRFRYANDGSGILSGLMDDGSGETLEPKQLALAWVIPGRQLQGLTWRDSARYSDDFGRVVLIKHPDGRWSNASYDARDRLLEQQGADGKRMSLRWNASSNPVEKDYGESGRSLFEWSKQDDHKALLLSARREAASTKGPTMEIHWAYDKDQRVIKRSHHVGRHRFNWNISRDHQGRVVKEQLPDGANLIYRYDEHGLLAISYQQGLGSISQHLYQRIDERSRKDQDLKEQLRYTQRHADRSLGEQSPAVGATDGSIAYRLGNFVVRWQQKPGSSGELQALEVEGLAKWVLHPESSRPESSKTQASKPHAASNPSLTQGLARNTKPARPEHSEAPAIAKTFRYDGAQAWLGDQQTTMHYDPLGQPALLSVQDRPGQIMVMDGWRQLLLADEAKGLQALVVWHGALPIAWIESGRVYHLAVDWRGAPVLAFDSTGKVHWKANYLHPLLSEIKHGNGRRKIAARGLSDRFITDRPRINLGVPGRILANEQLAQRDPRLKTLQFGANRVLDAESQRFLQADPLGAAGDRDPYRYAEGEPWRYVDPWGLAKLTYFAILQSEQGKPSASTQGFSPGRWSFLLEAIAPAQTAPGSSLSGWQGLQNEYAKTQQSLLFDGQGSFRLSQQDPLLGRWFGEDSLRFQADQGDEVMQGFRQHYGGSLISQSAFVIEDFDDNQATRLMALLSRDQKARRACLQPATPVLPPMKFNDGSADLRPDAPQGQGSSVQRLLECETATSGIPEPLYLGLYANAQERARVERLQAAAQLQEAPAPSSIQSDCSKDACRSKTAIAVNGREYFASYGSTQFVLETFLRTLRQDVLHATDLDPRTLSWLGLDQSIKDTGGQSRSMSWWINQGIARAQSAAQAFDALRARHGKGLSQQAALELWNKMTASQQLQWQASSGLDREAFVDILGFSPDGRARTESEARNAFAAHAVFRLGSGNSAGFGDWLKALFSDQARFGLISRLLLRQHLRTLLAEPALQARLSNLESPTTKAFDQRQQSIEQDIAYRVALMHNGGKQAAGALDPNRKPPAYLQHYAEEFMRVAGRGNWQALRCGQSLGVAGLQMQTVKLA